MRLESALLLLVVLQLPPGGAARASERIFVDDDRDSTLIAARVEPSVLGYLTLIREDGTKTHVMSQDVVSIRDSSGRDLTERVLDRWRSVGTAPAIPSPPPARPLRAPALRGRPSPLDDGFPIIQVGYLSRLDESSGPRYYESGASVVADLGGMKNMGSSFALGATVHMGLAEESVRLGLKSRVRAWLGKTTSLDLGPGILFSGSESNKRPPGLVTELSLTFGDWVALTGQMEVRRFQEESAYDTDVAWLFGAKVGGELGLAAFLPAMVVGATLSQTRTEYTQDF